MKTMTRANQRVSAALLDLGCVNFNVETPYTLTSGALAPVYIDCRFPISDTAARNIIIEEACGVLEDLDFDVIAGGETAGIAYAALLADRLQKDMVYVRKEPKGFGKNRRIEGGFERGASVLLVEDLTFDGGSKVRFAESLREAGAIVNTTFSVFSYYGPEVVNAQLSAANLELRYLADWDGLLEHAAETGYFTTDQIATIRDFLANPKSWSPKNA